MCDACLQKSTHLLTEVCVFLSIIFAKETVALHYIKNGCYVAKGGVLYMGSRNVTVTGKACQPWAANSPHQVSDKIQDVMFPDGSKEAAKNFCRNPDIQNNDGVWCYTMEATLEWEFCDICPDNYEGYNACVLSDKGAGYTGLLAHSKSFQVCLPWKENEDPTFKFADGSAEDAKNYCRNPNPDAREAPWCFVIATGGANNWDYCDVCKPFEGKISLEPGYSHTEVHSIVFMSRLACLHWCITMGFCLGVSVSQEKTGQCWYIVDSGGEIDAKDKWDTYIVDRSCRGDTGGRKNYFVDSSGVKTENAEFVSNDATLDECLAACTAKPNCRFAEMNTTDKSCSVQTIFNAKQVSGPDVTTRSPVYCDPGLQSTEDVKAESDRLNPTTGLLTTRNMIIGGAAIAVVTVIVGGLVCYKLKGKGKGKGKGKHKDKHKSKHKGKDKDKSKRKRKRKK